MYRRVPKDNVDDAFPCRIFIYAAVNSLANVYEVSNTGTNHFFKVQTSGVGMEPGCELGSRVEGRGVLYREGRRRKNRR